VPGSGLPVFFQSLEPAKPPCREPETRKTQILQLIAQMLENPKRPKKSPPRRLAARLEVSEAALYRHFASKAQMFEGLIEFIESSIFGLINKITADEPMAETGACHSRHAGGVFLRKTPAWTRVLIGDALVNEKRAPAGAHQCADGQDRIQPEAMPAGGADRQRAARERRCGRRGQPDAVLHGRPLAPVCQKRLQEKPGGRTGKTVAAIAGLNIGADVLALAPPISVKNLLAGCSRALLPVA